MTTIERELIERFVESLVTNADDLSSYLHPDIELLTLLDGTIRSGKQAVLEVLKRTAENTLHVEDWGIIEYSNDVALIQARFVGRLPSNVVQEFQVVWRLTFERGLIRSIYPYTDEEGARTEVPTA